MSHIHEPGVNIHMSQARAQFFSLSCMCLMQVGSNAVLQELARSSQALMSCLSAGWEPCRAHGLGAQPQHSAVQRNQA